MNKKNETPEALAARLEKLTKEYEKKLKELEELEKNKEPVKTSAKIKDITKKSGEDYVEIRLFKDGDKYRDDVLVGINGYMCRIKRGVPVKIKKKFADLITQAEENTAKVNANFVSRDGKMERFC